MIKPNRLIDSDPIAAQGQSIFERDILPSLKSEDMDKFVAVDIVSGSYEIDNDDITVVMRLHERLPDAKVWLLRVGHPTAYRM